MSDTNIVPVDLDPKNSKVARRTLLTTAYFTLILANLNILSEQVSFFGVSIELDQDKLIALGQVSTFALFIVYIVKELPNLNVLLHVRTTRRINASHKFARNSLSGRLEMEYRQPDQYDDLPNSDIQALEIQLKNEKESVDQRAANRSANLTFISDVFSCYIVPVLMAIPAISCPTSLGQLLTYISKL
ncbi:hypothetical protein DS901_04035 [Loktanella sp. D2R18]|uniref:hypothetical protein n=1 Tax=Rhodobacterales TaxID=204455 RepID=UPI000DFB6CFF|nr:MULTISPECIES: hypothetical protein [Rhodobacterales]MDO6589173.1 hypothetical protein [Yoonia sp. 1_MG-2023]RBW45399.1 hypothetical protein DS901_04035 [Loktanella sp. D2R18]